MLNFDSTLGVPGLALLAALKISRGAKLRMVKRATQFLRAAAITLDLDQTTLGKLEGERGVGSLLSQRGFYGDLLVELFHEKIDVKEFRQ